LSFVDDIFLASLIGGLFTGLIGLMMIVSVRLVQSSPLESDPLGRRVVVQSFGGFLLLAGGLAGLVAMGVAAAGWLFITEDPDLLPVMGVVFLVSLPCFIIGAVLVRAGRTLGAPAGEIDEEREKSLQRQLRAVGIVGWGLLVLSGIATSGLSLLCLPLLVMLARSIHNGRASRQGMLLWSLAMAAERRLPLIPEFEDFALVTGGAWQSRARQVADRLRAGETLAGALERVPGLLPPFVTLAIQVGEETGSLPQALREAALGICARQQRAGEVTSWSTFWVLISYLLVIGGTVVFFICYFIVPKFKKIFSDFGTELPPITQAVLHLADSGILLALPFGIMTVALVCYVSGLLRGWGEFDIPGINWLFPHIHGPPIVRNLAVVTETGRPLISGLAALANGYPKRPIRRRLQRVLQEVESGGPCWPALRRENLIGARDMALLAAAERVGNLPWTLRVVADGIQRRRWNRLLVWTEFLQPALIICIGLVVLVIAVAFFYPMVSLLEHVGTLAE
jgi:type II secretory pathway component PulF